VSHGDEMIQSANDEVNIAKDPGLWLDFSVDGVAYWNAREPSDCQHHNELFNKSYRYFSSGQPVRYCSQKYFVGTKANGEKYERESGYCIHHHQDQFIVLFVSYLALNISHILLQEKCSVTGEINHHEKKHYSPRLT